MEVEDYWEKDDTQSMSDFRISNLESLMISKHIESHDRLLNVGCGDGTGCSSYRDIPDEYIGIERSSMMIKRFEEKVPDVKIIQSDMRDMPDIGSFSKILTQRSLINLESPSDQKDVLNNLSGMIERGGSLLLCEAFVEGLERMNELRRGLNLTEHKQRWHNLYLTIDTVSVLEKDMFLEYEEDLSFYFLVTRILRPLIDENVSSTNSKMNEMAEFIQPLVPDIKNIGYIKLQKWTLK